MNNNNVYNKKVLIIGLGMIGGSYAKGLKNKGITPYGYDICKETMDYCVENELIDKEIDLIENVKRSDLIILCLYPNINIKWLKEYQMYLKPGAVITDVTGVKSYIINEAKTFLREDVEFVPSHPMAGREISGIKGSNPEVFKDANFIVVPMDENSYESISLVKNLAELLEFKNIEVLTAKSHDELISFLSQLTHIIAVSLMNSHDVTQMIRYTGDSFRDLTRIAKINENLWSELFSLNSKQLVKDIDSFQKELESFKNLLVNNDINGMKEKMIKSTERRKLFDKKV